MNHFRKIIRNRAVRLTLATVIIVATFGLFTHYLINNPEVIQTVLSLSPLTLLLLSAAYALTILANVFVLHASLAIIKKFMPFSENITLTSYSSIVNFFGPLQSGPGFRAAYLKKRHNVSIKKFFYLTVIFYAFFALINGLIIMFSLMVSYADVWLSSVMTVLLISVAGLTTWVLWQRIPRLRHLLQSIPFNNIHTWYIGAGALLLSAATTLAYFLELTHIDASIRLWQVVVYAAAANLSLFVSLTPGAIGFRESFLLLSQQLHNISPETILAASIIDRAFYVLFLLALFVILLLFGTRRRLQKISRD